MNQPAKSPNFRVQQKLLEVCRTSTASLEFEPLMSVLIDAASELTTSEWSWILTRIEETEQLVVTALPFYMKETKQSAPVTVRNSLAGQAIESFQAVVFNSSKAKESVDKDLWESTQKANSVLAVPIIFRGKVLGVIESFNKVNGGAYNSQDIEVLELLAGQAAGAIQNHYLAGNNDQAIQKMLELDRMKSDFISIASHELRTPLGLIIGHAAFLKDTAHETQKNDLDVISRSAERMKDLIDDFGDMESITNGMKTLKRGRVSFDTLVPEVVGMFQALSKENKVRLAYELKGSNLTVEGDAGKLELVLRNLIKNGIIFTNPGGVVKVTVEEVPGFVKITVLDNGIGIPAGEIRKIFNRFYQVEKHLTRKHGGMGIGLSSAKEMVELHGGKISVESVESKGSRFTVLIPLNAAQAKAAQKVFLG
jgi:signal transduction histidine kinase